MLRSRIWRNPAWDCHQTDETVDQERVRRNCFGMGLLHRLMTRLLRDLDPGVAQRLDPLGDAFAPDWHN